MLTPPPQLFYNYRTNDQRHIVVAKTIAQPIHAHSSSSSSHGHVIHIFSCSQDDIHSLTVPTWNEPVLPPYFLFFLFVTALGGVTGRELLNGS